MPYDQDLHTGDYCPRTTEPAWSSSSRHLGTPARAADAQTSSPDPERLAQGPMTRETGPSTLPDLVRREQP